MISCSHAFKTAATLPTGFAVEQYLRREGFEELGRRTNAAAFSISDDPMVVRISEDNIGSTYYFRLAQQNQGNPYFPRVFDQVTLPSGDHIVIVERLNMLSSKPNYLRMKEIAAKRKLGISNNDDEIWAAGINARFEEACKICKAFMNENHEPDFQSFFSPVDFRSAAMKIIRLAEWVNREIDNRFIPIPDMNRTNILFRDLPDGSFFPVLYDALSIGHYGQQEITHAEAIRTRFGLMDRKDRGLLPV